MIRAVDALTLTSRLCTPIRRCSDEYGINHLLGNNGLTPSLKCIKLQLG